MELKEKIRQMENSLLIQEPPQLSPELDAEPTSEPGAAPVAVSQSNLDHFLEELKITEKSRNLSGDVKNKNLIVNSESYGKSKQNFVPMTAPMSIFSS